MALSRFNSASNEVASGAETTTKSVAVLNLRHKTRLVRPLEIQLRRRHPHFLRRDTFGCLKYESSRMLDAHRFRFTRHRILDRLQCHIDGIAHANRALPAFHLKLNR